MRTLDALASSSSVNLYAFVCLRCGRYSLPETLGVLLPMARSVLRAVRYL